MKRTATKSVKKGHQLVFIPQMNVDPTASGFSPSSAVPEILVGIDRSLKDQLLEDGDFELLVNYTNYVYVTTVGSNSRQVNFELYFPLLASTLLALDVLAETGERVSINNHKQVAYVFEPSCNEPVWHVLSGKDKRKFRTDLDRVAVEDVRKESETTLTPALEFCLNHLMDWVQTNIQDLDELRYSLRYKDLPSPVFGRAAFGNFIHPSNRTRLLGTIGREDSEEVEPL